MQRRIGLTAQEKSSLATATRSSVGAVYKLDRRNPWNIGWLADAAIQQEVSDKVQPFSLQKALLSAILERWSCVSVVHVRLTFSVVLWMQQWLPVEQMQGATVDLASRLSNMRHALLEAVKAADQRDDEIMGSRLKWQLCYAILLGAEGATFPVSRILSIIKQASLDMLSSFSC